jgi:hypothetical protein
MSFRLEQKPRYWVSDKVNVYYDYEQLLRNGEIWHVS